MKWIYYNLESTGQYTIGDHETSNIGYQYGISDNFSDKIKRLNENKKIASFDMDSTLICTKSGKTFPKNSDDWKWLYPCSKQKLWTLFKSKYKIIIITNQAGIKNSKKRMDEFKNKIEQIEQSLLNDYPVLYFEIYCLPHKDIHRKPYPTIFENILIDRTKSFYCGDAAGRKVNGKLLDPSSADIKFAYNCL